MLIVCKPVGRGYRLQSVIAINGGHMERAITFVVGEVFEFRGIKWRILGVQP